MPSQTIHRDFKGCTKTIPLAVSPADTFDTTLTSPSTFDSSLDAQRPLKITFDQNVKTPIRNQIFGMTKPLLVMTLLFLISIAAVGYLLNGWFIVPQLKAEIKRLESQVDRLVTENDRYEILNDELNYTVSELTNLTDSLNVNVMELSDISNELEIANDRLSDITLDQNETLSELKYTLASFVAENDRLQELNSDLLSITTFLNSTSLGLDDSLEEWANFIGGLIVANQALVLESLKTNYKTRLIAWDCDYRDVFREESFGVDYNLPISDISSVMAFVDDRVLSELCLDVSDFEIFLFEQFPDYVSTHRLIRGVSQYTSQALDYLFPEHNDDGHGVSQIEWEEAGFNCRNLKKAFIMI